MISLFSTDSGESQGTADSSVVTFATGPNPSLTAQRADEEPSKSEQQSKQPTICYVNAKDIRRRLEENAACQPQRSFKVNVFSIIVIPFKIYIVRLVSFFFTLCTSCLYLTMLLRLFDNAWAPIAQWSTCTCVKSEITRSMLVDARFVT